MYEAKFQGWDKLTLIDILMAYRKAKSDCYYEKNIGIAEKLATYEENLLENIKELLKTIKNDKGIEKYLDFENSVRLYPKKVQIESSNKDNIYFSDSQRSYESLSKDPKNIVPEFRVIGDFDINIHILSALWVNMIGHKYDAILPKTAYASRLKRIKFDKYDEKLLGEFHLTAIGSFQPYFQPYQSWRRDGLKTIETELKNDKKVIAISLDLDSYYHNINPEIFKYDATKLDLGLNNNEIAFHNQFIDLLIKWNKQATQYIEKLLPSHQENSKEKLQGGLVIGLTASRILANVLLYDWDSRITSTLTPLHYGRYVDDMLLVILDPENTHDSNSVMKYLKQKVGSQYLEGGRSSKDPSYNLYPFGKKTDKSNFFKLQMKKQKIYFLEGQAGLDIISTIQTEINELSSEYRKMPSPNELDETISSNALMSQSANHQITQNLSHIENISIKRLGWALQLRQAETLANDLKPSQWQGPRKELFEFANNHILTPINLFSFFDYVPRLLGLAIFLNEWEYAEKIVFRIYKTFEELKKTSINHIVINGVKYGSAHSIKDDDYFSEVWNQLNITIKALIKETYLSHHEFKNAKLTIELTNLEKRFLVTLNKFFDKLIEFKYLPQIRKLKKSCQLIAKADFNRIGFKEITKNYEFNNLIEPELKYVLCNSHFKEFIKTPEFNYLTTYNIPKSIKNEIVNGIAQILHDNDIIDLPYFNRFFDTARHSYNLEMFEEQERKLSKETVNTNLLSFLFPTRPFSMMEISEFIYPVILGLEENLKDLFKYVNTFRGTKFFYTDFLFEDEKINHKSEKKLVKIGNGKNNNPTIALTNFETKEQEWALMACNKPDLSLDRYYKISALINQCITIKPKPNYIVFPELSIPNEWIDSMARSLQAAGINLIAGTYYKHYKNTDKVTNQCILVLSTDYYGKNNFVKLTQYKILPAVKEEEDLLKIHNKTWVNFKQAYINKPIYIHNDFHFGTMICSELQNSKERIKFQGNVDALLTLSWNKDTESFASLIDASALDIHGYMVLVNNRVYGDSRIRVPFKASYKRDVVRFRGGENDLFVISSIDTKSLREFQSRAKRWVSDSDLFKTTPEGYELLSSRRILPAK